MIKRGTFILVLMFLMPDTFAQTVNDDAAFFNNRYDKNVIKKNKIEQIEIRMFAMKELYSIQTFYFDSAGFLYRQTIADSTGKLNAQFDFSYNSFGDLIYREQQDFELKNHDTVIFYRTYNDSLLVRESSSLTPVVNEYFYDKAKRRVKTISCFMQQNECVNRRIITNTYDKNDRLIRVKELTFKNSADTAGVLTSERELAYNKNGKIVSDTEKTAGDKFISSAKGSVTYVYDGSGNLTGIFKSNGTTNKYKYNSGGLIVSKELTLSADGNQTKVNDIYNYKYKGK